LIFLKMDIFSILGGAAPERRAHAGKDDVHPCEHYRR